MTDPTSMPGGALVANANLAKAEADEQLAVANDWYARLEAFVITSDEQQEQIAGVLRDVKTRYKAIEDKRTSFTKPLNDVIKGLNEFFRPPKTKFETLERLLKSKITAYLQSKALANVVALEAAAKATTPQVAQQAIARVAPVEPPKGVSVRYVWKFVVENADLVPREFCSPDTTKIANSGRQDIPGVRFFKEPVVVSRSR